MKWILYEPQPWKARLDTTVMRSAPKWFGPWRRVGDLLDKPPPNAAAIWGFATLGDLANSSCPELVRIMVETQSGLVQTKAGSALARMGSNGWPFLVGILTNEANPLTVRTAAVRSMREAGGAEATPLVPVLARYVSLRDPELSREAAITLGMLRLDAEHSVPALAAGLKSEHARVRWACAYGLGSFEASARPALPMLVDALDDPDRFVKATVIKALEKVELGITNEEVSKYNLRVRNSENVRELTHPNER